MWTSQWDQKVIITKPSHGWLFDTAMSVAVVLGVILAGYGWYVLTNIAKS